MNIICDCGNISEFRIRDAELPLNIDIGEDGYYANLVGDIDIAAEHDQAWISCKCGKKMNPSELAMFYKTYGRYENVEQDDRELLCKKCFCENEKINVKEYANKYREYRDNGCNLF